ncbi:helix-turn-helix domain-containing protein [Paradevosia shaoguanensis]|uniref:helix-turn-helix domain-containing protein n=1 Tax=Paradevosia shaoguanensis TaxID=1335043 RepID=UPI003C7561D7
MKLTMMVNRLAMEALRAWRTRSELSLDEAGHLVGVSGVQWHRYETGTRKVSPNRVLQIERLTGVPRYLLRPDIYGSSPVFEGGRTS